MASQFFNAPVDFDAIFAQRASGWAQAANTGYTIAGVDLAVRYAVAATGTAARDVGYSVNGVDIGPTFAALGSSAVTVATQPANVSGSASAGVSGTITSSAATCAAGSQGGPTKTYAWTTSGCTANSPSSASSTFHATVAENSTVNATAYCTISDGVTGVRTNTISVTLTNTYVAVYITTQPSAVSGSSAAGNPSGTVTSGTTSCVAAGGSGTISHTWALVSGSGCSFTAGTSQTTAVTETLNAATSNSGTMRCTVSDGTTSAVSNAVAWSLTNTSPAYAYSGTMVSAQIATGAYGYSAPDGSLTPTGPVYGETITQLYSRYAEGIYTSVLVLSGTPSTVPSTITVNGTSYGLSYDIGYSYAIDSPAEIFSGPGATYDITII